MTTVLPRYTPLMEASREGHEDVVRLLIESGEEGAGRRGGEKERGERYSM